MTLDTVRYRNYAKCHWNVSTESINDELDETEGDHFSVIGGRTMRNHEKRVAISPPADSRGMTTTKRKINGRTTIKHVILDCVNIESKEPSDC